MNKNNNKIVLITCLAVMFFIALGVYFIGKNNKALTKKETILDKFKDIDLMKCNAKICEYEINTNTMKSNLIYEKKDDNYSLTLDDKKIMDSKNKLIQLIAFNDIIVLKYQENNNYKIKAIDKNNNVLFDYQYLDTTYNLNITSQDIEYKNKAIFIYTTKIFENKLMDNNHLIDLCIDEVKKLHNTEVISGKYEIKFEKNQFSKPNMIEKKRLSDIFIKCE